jgi:DNA-binding MarR family transcriptional regulator
MTMVDKQEPDLLEELRPRLLRISQALRRETKLLPITRAQSAVMSAILIGKPMRLSDLARAEAVTLPTMNQVINRMLLSGWVVKLSPPGTANNLIDITDEGRKIAAQAADMRNDALLRRIKRLTPEECQSLAHFFPIIDKMFSKEPWVYDPAAESSA